ncbi:helix-turn-helix domain-containing protein [Mucilaginibacter ginsenosidivorans]|uniref:AraC family transcriptional regulator n=1 Tax=Mucilaginibacter ginsenosidivorans TaxID=398053 RepID=A0A5B8USC2_9SPHI|nr:helix-turn-helix domain-containing protein [Mucilaginibacter ginsenosidivorans]QEC61635.1 AraC family transcriptional regulator [Mucilaginibacter ginsenosidivorans]
MQLPPSPAWSFCIKHYLFLKCSYRKPLRLFSDGNTGMVFVTGGQLIIRKKDSQFVEPLPAAFIYGQLGDYLDIISEDETELLIVVFQPYGFFSLCGIPAEELKAQIIDANLIFGRQSYSVNDALSSAGSYPKAIATIEGYFKSLFKDSGADANQLRTIVNAVMQVKGQLTVNELVNMTGYTERRLERIFDQAIGTSPVKYLQIVRLHHFLSLIRSSGKKDSLTIAGLESGYYDQAHLIRNFKQITGLTPTQYRSAARTLAVNLVIVN